MLEEEHLLIDRLKNGSYIMYRENNSNLDLPDSYCGTPTRPVDKSLRKSLELLLGMYMHIIF